MIDTVVINLSQPIECITPGVNPNVNEVVWVIMMCQCRFIITNVPLWRVMWIMGKAMCVEWARENREISVSSSQLGHEPNIALKTNSTKKLILNHAYHLHSSH